MGKIVLFSEKKDCSGCGACSEICPKQAITMQEDEYGFIYPNIEHKLCVKCGMCQKVCGYKKQNLYTVKKAYAGISKINEILNKSASGGIFSSLANEVIKNGGVVFGCSMERENDGVKPKHICVTEQKDLYKLQGSKYVQSTMGKTYEEVKKYLNQRVEVLFSGTPCQIAALKGYLGNVGLDFLYTVDIICHGTPSAKLFSDYIKVLEQKCKGVIREFNFRDKTLGWGLNGSYVYDQSGKIRKKYFSCSMSSYYRLFLDSEIYRESCYSCCYAGRERVGDITIGDYWGLEEVHPEFLGGNGGRFSVNKGISCVLVNMEKGEKLLNDYGKYLHLQESTIQNVSKKNGQLNAVSKKGENSTVILETYKADGYQGIEKWYMKKLGWKRVAYRAYDSVPINIQKSLMKMREKI